VPKETSHRGDELKTLGWSEPEVNRYVELFEYRQRWGAMNLEREDRLFLRKAEHALPAILSGRAAAKKSTNEKSYYRWLRFHLDAMKAAEAGMDLAENEQGAWPIMLEVELRIIDHYEPVLGLPDTIKAKALGPLRELLAAQAAALGSTQSYDFQAALIDLKAKESSRWRHLRDGDGTDRTYPLLSAEAAPGFRDEAHREIHGLIRSSFPSLADTDKSELTNVQPSESQSSDSQPSDSQSSDD
tara:strand:- start:9428 stop:10156 length:729 start_codon:yes stop_codon:yes gene_type:complete